MMNLVVVRCLPRGGEKNKLILKSVVIFTFNFQRQKNTFQHLSTQHSFVICDLLFCTTALYR